AKGHNLTRDPRVSVVVWDRDNAYRYLSIEGNAVLDTEGADEHIDKLAWQYWGRGYENPRERVIVRVRPERVYVYGFDGGFGSSPATWGRATGSRTSPRSCCRRRGRSSSRGSRRPACRESRRSRSSATISYRRWPAQTRSSQPPSAGAPSSPASC